MFLHYFPIFRALYGNSSSSTNGGVEIRRVLQKHQDTTNYRTSGFNNNNNINLGISARVSSLEKCFSLPCQLSQCSESKKTIIRRQRHLATKNSVTVMEVASNITTIHDKNGEDVSVQLSNNNVGIGNLNTLTRRSRFICTL